MRVIQIRLLTAIALALLELLFTGCGPSYYADSAINRKVKNQTVGIKFVNDSTAIAENVVIEKDSVLWASQVPVKHTLQRDNIKSISFLHLENNEGIISLKSGKEIYAFNISESSDKISYDEQVKKLNKIARENIEYIEVEDDGLAAIYGLGIGAAIGAGIAFLLTDTKNYYRPVYMVIGGVLGGTVGFINGLAIGSPRRYYLYNER